MHKVKEDYKYWYFFYDTWNLGLQISYFPPPHHPKSSFTSRNYFASAPSLNIIFTSVNNFAPPPKLEGSRRSLVERLKLKILSKFLQVLVRTVLFLWHLKLWYTDYLFSSTTPSKILFHLQKPLCINHNTLNHLPPPIARFHLHKPVGISMVLYDTFSMTFVKIFTSFGTNGIFSMTL